MSVDGRSVANFVLDHCDSRNCEITHLSLQKIVYFCHAWSLVKFNRPLIKHQFEAWQFGPVLQYLYREFKDYGDVRITSRAMKIDPETGLKKLVEYEFDQETVGFLGSVLGFYSQLSAVALMNLSHAEDGPWHKVWHHQGDLNLGMKINNQLIQEYYLRVHPPFAL